MVHTPSPRALLDAWERGLAQSPVELGLTLLEVASPAEDRESLATLSIGERDRRLLALREAIFGSHMTGLVSCLQCGEQLELELATHELLRAPSDAALSLHGHDHDVQLRLPDSRDLLAVAQVEEDVAPALLLERCLVYARVGGQTVDAAHLPVSLVAEAAQCLAEADPHADLRFTLTCPACSVQWAAPLDITAYLWTEIDAWAARALAGVHALASAYGWSENEILGLSPARRQSYLQMVGA